MYKWPPHKNVFWWTVTVLFLGIGIYLICKDIYAGGLCVVFGCIFSIILFLFWISETDDDDSEENEKDDGDEGGSVEQDLLKLRSEYASFIKKAVAYYGEPCVIEYYDFYLKHEGLHGLGGILVFVRDGEVYLQKEGCSEREIKDLRDLGVIAEALAKKGAKNPDMSLLHTSNTFVDMLFADIH